MKSIFFQISQMCLGHTVKDEFNIVELVSGEGDNAKGVPIATLHAKSMPTVSELFLVFCFSVNETFELIFLINVGQVNLSGLDLHPPVTFRLKHGSGPVFVGAEHVACEFTLT